MSPIKIQIEIRIWVAVNQRGAAASLIWYAISDLSDCFAHLVYRDSSGHAALSLHVMTAKPNYNCCSHTASLALEECPRVWVLRARRKSHSCALASCVFSVTHPTHPGTCARLRLLGLCGLCVSVISPTTFYHLIEALRIDFISFSNEMDTD
jgi:hypothetical protein